MSPYKFKVGQRVKYSFDVVLPFGGKSNRHGEGIVEARYNANDSGFSNAYDIKTPRRTKFVFEHELRAA